MRGAPTPAWTLILVPPTPKAAPKRLGVKMRTVRVLCTLALMALAPALVMAWSWVDAQSSASDRMADRLAAQDQLVAVLTDSLATYRRESDAEHAAKLPPAAMIMPVAGRISSWFSLSRLHPILHIRRPHEGIDLSATAGTRVVAPATAVVASVSRQFGFGLLVELVHSGGVVTRYAHLRTALVKAGDRVAVGQAIATVGASGLATSPHLHFEVLVKGTPVDPLRFLPH